MPITFLLVLVTWVFFRATGFTDAWAVLMAMVGATTPTDKVLHYRLYEVAIVVASGCLVWLEPFIVRTAERTGIMWWWRVPYWLRGAAYAALTLFITAFGGVTQKFIYFDF
jgi:alginate O-acetyltransferase complex protein AlgI